MSLKWFSPLLVLMVCGCQTLKQPEKIQVTDHGKQIRQDQDDLSYRCVLATQSTPTEIQALEKTVQKNPQDRHARRQLLGYYSGQKIKPDAKVRSKGEAKYYTHMKWFMDSHPEDTVLSTRGCADLFSFEKGYKEFGDQWLELVKAHPQNYQILFNALYFHSDEPRNFEAILQAGSAQFPHDVGLHLKRYNLYRARLSLDSFAPEDLKKASDELAYIRANTSPEDFKHEMALDLPKMAYMLGNKVEAKREAEIMIRDAEESRDQFAPIRLALAHTVLGMLAMDDKNIALANEHLEKSATDSFVSASFGPEFILARRLLKADQRDAVLRYVTFYEDVWKSPRAKEELSRWRAEAQEVRAPSQAH